MGIQKLKNLCNYLTTNLFLTNSIFVPPDNSNNKHDTFKLKTDTGKDAHKLLLNKLTEIKNGPRVMLPDKATIIASHQGVLPITQLLKNTAKEAHVYPQITNTFLLSIGQLYGNGYLAIFLKDIYIF